MTTDRTTKTLLVIIGVALWGFLLRPVFTATPVQAGQPNSSQQNFTAAASNSTVMIVDQRNVFVAENGKLSPFVRNANGALTALAVLPYGK